MSVLALPDLYKLRGLSIVLRALGACVLVAAAAVCMVFIES